MSTEWWCRKSWVQKDLSRSESFLSLFSGTWISWHLLTPCRQLWQLTGACWSRSGFHGRPPILSATHWRWHVDVDYGIEMPGQRMLGQPDPLRARRDPSNSHAWPVGTPLRGSARLAPQGRCHTPCVLTVTETIWYVWPAWWQDALSSQAKRLTLPRRQENRWRWTASPWKTVSSCASESL